MLLVFIPFSATGKTHDIKALKVLILGIFWQEQDAQTGSKQPEENLGDGEPKGDGEIGGAAAEVHMPVYVCAQVCLCACECPKKIPTPPPHDACQPPSMKKSTRNQQKAFACASPETRLGGTGGFWSFFLSLK